MTDGENDVLIEIAQTTAQTEERARKIEHDIQDLKDRYLAEAEKRDERLESVETQVQRHDVILNGGLVTLIGGVSAFFGWLFGLINL